MRKIISLICLTAVFMVSCTNKPAVSVNNPDNDSLTIDTVAVDTMFSGYNANGDSDYGV